MRRFAFFGRLAGWIASVSIVVYALAMSALTFGYFSPCDLPDWAETVAMYLGYAVAAVALNPLSWRLFPFGSVLRRLIFAVAGLAIAYAIPTSDPSHLQGDCSQNI